MFFPKNPSQFTKFETLKIMMLPTSQEFVEVDEVKE
jgi:hypothetical protein